MYLQRIKILRRQANWRSRSLSRHKQPKLAQLSNALRNTSENRRQRNQRVPVLCRWQLHQKSQGNGGRVSRAKQLKGHLSYGGRVTLRCYPFFMPGVQGSLASLGETKIEKTSKLITNACLFFKNGGSGIPVERQARKDKQAETLLIQGFSLLWRGRSPSRRPDREPGAPVIELEKTSKLKRSYNNVSACSGEREARAGRCPGTGSFKIEKTSKLNFPFPTQSIGHRFFV